ncbi:hypothetical protein [Parasitella parasitica]|uniref:PiggyBac transposable element-derived protein domain-containing protein n=1 Tax=Parasitella parasitica TaxID=35722 RepID=A0A0B7NRQ5_9FUNG|nr:hypothetical protein [Parasitella parasitica]
MVDDNAAYEVVLDEVPAITMTLQATCITYLESNPNAATEALVETGSASVVPERALEETVEPDTEEESDDDLELHLTPAEGWMEEEVYIDARVQRNNSFSTLKSKITLPNATFARPLDYFLFFLPLEHFHFIIMNMNQNAKRNLDAWTDVTFPEYLM